MEDAERKALLSDVRKRNDGHFKNQERIKVYEDIYDRWWEYGYSSGSGSGSISGSGFGSGSSSGSTSYSNSDSSDFENEWESSVEPNGELFFIESSAESFLESKIDVEETSCQLPDFSMCKGICAGKFKRKRSMRNSMRNKKLNPENFKTERKCSNSDQQSGNEYDIIVRVDPNRRHKLKRKKGTICEAYLGIIPSVLRTDNTKIVVGGFSSENEARKYVGVKIGDWIRSINSQIVTPTNLKDVLANIVSPTNVTLNFHRLNTQETKQSPLVRQLIDRDHAKSSLKFLTDLNFEVVYSKISGFTESGSENQGVLYSYPHNGLKNTSSILFSTKGAFLTLSHVLPENIGFSPVSSLISASNETIHIIYTSFQDELLLMAYPDKWCSKTESIELTKDILRTLIFTHESISKCFGNQDNHLKLDHFFSLFFARIVAKSPYKTNLDSQKEYLPIRIHEFEAFLPAAHFIPLPRDAQMQIDLTLNEMEAMDYRDMHEDSIYHQRLYTIVGSCLYHKHYLLGSHLPHEIFILVNSFLRQNGLLNLVSSESVSSLIIWKKIYPSQNITTNLEQNEEHFFLGEKCFLLVVGYGNDILAVILESGEGCTAKLESNSGPDAFYIEEAQAMLQHIQETGVPMLAEKWISANAKPEIASVEECLTTKASISLTENLLNFIKATDSQSTLTKSNVYLPNRTVKSLEAINYVKQRNSEDNHVKSGSVYSLQTSEDTLSQGTSVVSEIIDETAPILGRRATREKSNNASRQSEDSDSDLDVYKNEGQTSTLDVSNIRENLLNQAEYITPKRLTTARYKNCLFHYVHFDLFEGILLSSYIDRQSSNNAKFLNNFNQCASVIHKLLQDAMRFKKMLNQDTDKSVINKSLIAIKEYGVLFQWENVLFWVVGRLYTMRQPKELYVCYDESVPQNLIEIAFRLNAMEL